MAKIQGGKHIKTFRLNNTHITQKEFAKGLGYCASHIQYIEKGDVFPSHEFMLNFANYFGIKPGDVFQWYFAEN